MLFLTVAVPSQCYDYKTLSSSKRRFDLRKLVSEADVKCDGNDGRKNPDWNGPGWYRVVGQAGTKLSETPYYVNDGNRGYACNTYYGGWLTGGHPSSIGETVARTVCHHTKYCRSLEKTSIEVTKCNGYYVYNLKEKKCRRGYCTQ